MKKLMLLAVAGGILSGCANEGTQEKSALDSVMAVHEKVMNGDDQLMKNKAELDNLAKQSKTGALADSVHIYLDKVALADSAMGTWMHNFDPDMTGKTHGQKMTYLSRQKKLIMQVDSQLSAAIAASGKFLAKTKTK